MKRKIGIISILIIIAIIILVIGIIIGININKFNEKNEFIEKNSEKLVKTTILIKNSNNEINSTITSTDITLSNELLGTCKAVMNETVMKTCIDANRINISSLNNTSCIVLAVWFSENCNDDKCIDDVKKSISEFKNELAQFHNIEINILDAPEIIKNI